MPRPALHLRNKRTAVKMVKTKGLSLRGPKGAVAISQYPVGLLETPGEIVIACVRLPRRFAPRNDKLESLMSQK